MKKPTLIIFSALFMPVLTFTASAQQSPVAPDAGAPSAAPSKPAPPPSDPFSRGATPPAPAAVRPKKEADAVNLLTTLETWAVDDADALALLEMPDSQGGGYVQLQTLAQTGNARLIAFTALSSKSGQRSAVEAVDEVRYATEFEAPERAGDMPFPTSWETINVGDELEVEAVMRPDEPIIEVRVAPKAVRLTEFSLQKVDLSSVPVSQPLFDEYRINTTLALSSGHAAIFSIAKPTAAENGREMHVQALRVVAQPNPASVEKTRVGTSGRIDLLVYRMDRAIAARVLRDGADSNSTHEAVRELVARGTAELELFRAFITRPEINSVSEQRVGFRYPDALNPPRYSPRDNHETVLIPSSPRNFQTRNLGPAVEVSELSVDQENRLATVSIVPVITSHRGKLQISEGQVGQPEQPVFSSRKIMTTVSVRFGQSILVGTLSQPRDNGVNGRVDDGKTSLAFIRLTPFTP